MGDFLQGGDRSGPIGKRAGSEEEVDVGVFDEEFLCDFIANARIAAAKQDFCCGHSGFVSV